MAEMKISREGLERALQSLDRATGGGAPRALSQADDDITMNKDFTDFVALLDSSGFMEDFDYQVWLGKKGVDLGNGDEARHFLEKADLAETRRLISAAVRLERFAPGTLQELYENGFFTLFAGKLLQFSRNL